MNKRIRKKQLKRLGRYIQTKDTYNLDMTIAQSVIHLNSIQWKSGMRS